MRAFGYAGLVAAGVVAAGLLSLGAGSEDDGETAIAARSCTERTGLEPGSDLGGGHPSKTFYEPGEEFDGLDLVHVIGDGYVVVRYRRDTPRRDRVALANWVTAAPSPVVGAPDDDQRKPIMAYAATRSLTCAKLDITNLERFRTRWVEDLDAGRVD